VAVVRLRRLFLGHCRADHNGKPGERLTPLHVACELGRVEDARALLQRGASVHARDTMGYTPLHCAAARGSVELCALLLGRGAELNARARTLRGEPGETPLMMACSGLVAGAAELLLRRGADPLLFSDDDKGTLLRRCRAVAVFWNPSDALSVRPWWPTAQTSFSDTPWRPEAAAALVARCSTLVRLGADPNEIAERVERHAFWKVCGKVVLATVPSYVTGFRTALAVTRAALRSGVLVDGFPVRSEGYATMLEQTRGADMLVPYLLCRGATESARAVDRAVEKGVRHKMYLCGTRVSPRWSVKLLLRRAMEHSASHPHAELGDPDAELLRGRIVLDRADAAMARALPRDQLRVVGGYLLGDSRRGTGPDLAML
jgi:hypothetical protein